MIDTRVTLDSIVGPYDCVATEEGRAPRFTLDVTREVSAGTLQMADDYGFSCTETVHVIDGYAGSPDTVHLFDSGETYVLNEDGERAPRAVAVRVCWRGKTPTVTPVPVNRETRRAARKTRSKARGGRGAAARTAVICVHWQWVDNEGSGALDVIEPLADGRYPIGGWVWPWCLVTWKCACGYEMGWHVTECLCGLTRDGQPPTTLAAASHLAGTELRTLAPETTSVTVDLTNSACIIDVFAGERVITGTDDIGPFDTETLGAADAILRQALDEDQDLAAAGWEHVPDEESARLYRITFPTSRCAPRRTRVTSTDTTARTAAAEPVLRQMPLTRKAEHWFWFELGPDGERIAYACVMQCHGFAWLEEIAVHPDHRGHGLATRLLVAAIDRFGRQQLGLGCEVFQPAFPVKRTGLDADQLRAWYGRHGFEPDDGNTLIRPAS
ncbi:GNAT family N-acetyltransferase [Streptomyces canus]|uniref:GNAT family N-acetyltransferase n=1 Tax=Streptomyces canus TaxID=58343 RepID=UPI00278B63C4|nr:GNAT family N-acetyltransferase [Streptomyces canus]MDQ0762021.1 GNAT superfamily N-acetyltransferase [Streptomyces canus]